MKCDGKLEKIHNDDILFVKAMQNYVIVQTTKRKYISLLFLKNVEENLNSVKQKLPQRSNPKNCWR